MLNLSEVKKHLYKFTDRNSKYFFKKHWKSILLTVWLLVSVAFILMFTWSLSRLNSKIFAQQEWIVLTSGNILEYCSNTWATFCNLNNKSITAIEPDAFVNHTNLKTLRLNWNQISSLNGVNLPDNLMQLYLENNLIASLSWINFPNTIRNLQLSNNQISSLNGVNLPDNLSNLYLNDNQISSLNWINFPDNLSNLALSNNQINSLNGVDLPDTLQHLELDSNEISSLNWINLPNTLQRLYLSNNQINSLNGVDLPDTLQHLELDSNEISSLNWINLPDTLQHLELDSNEISSLNWINLPDNLQRLNFSNNQINSLDGVDLPNTLQRLNFSNNQINSLDGVVLPDTLQTLALSNNQINSLDGIDLPDNLQYLYLENNGITSLDGINFPASLRYLYLNNNEITSLSWTNFSGVNYIYLQNNQITSLSWTNFSDSLLHLYLDNNQINSLDGIDLPDNLQYLYLNDNNIYILWDEFINVCWNLYTWYLNLYYNKIDHYNLSGELIDCINNKHATYSGDWKSTQTILWCTDHSAINYYNYATEDDGSCIYTSEAINIQISFQDMLIAFYDYSGYIDEWESIYQRYRWDNPISWANWLNYTINENDYWKYIRFSVVPVNISWTVWETGWSNPLYIQFPPEILSVQISGQNILTGFYTYSGYINEWESTYQRYRWDDTISWANWLNYTINENDYWKYIRLSVTPKDLSWFVWEVVSSNSIYIHFPPEALNTKILWTNNGLWSSLTWFYNYSGCFIEWDSIYQRYRWDNPIIGSNGLYYTISENDIWKHIRFSVIPININWTMGEIRRSSNTIYVPSPPKALNVQISGQTITWSVLTGFYVYSGDIEEWNSIYQRYKWTGAIVWATWMNYTVSWWDFGSYIYFAVTPVDSNWNTWTTSFSDWFNISDMNVIKKVNVVWFPVQWNLLLWIYDLLDNTWSGKLNYKWYRNDDLIATWISYRLVSGDVGHMVYFEVEPKTNSWVTLNKMKSNWLYVSPSYLVGSGENICVQQTSGFSSELVSAYLYSYKYWITTICPINSANLYWNLKRNHFAKMISEYAVNVLWKQANTWKNWCDKFADISYETAEMKKFIKTSCELWLMWISSDGVTAMKNFYPNWFVTRAEFGTVLSRLLYGNIYHSDKVYYEKHLQALKNKWIMKNIEKPLDKELRWRVMLMLMRADKNN